ncbi:LacI family DNA-binding transcriptional regulator [Nocardioides sp.]|uniref:LacI family DNA-binding transcriptional regulator n=1 Tax=Nocardioides sp. TaxID=35761 RepID=UPI003D1159C1
MKVRLTEIAQRAGVSVSTVSRVLNEKPGVNQHTRRQVLTAIDVLGYDRPSRLRPRAAGLVGLIVPELENPFFPRFAQLVESNLAGFGYTPVLCSQSLGGVHEDDYVQMLQEHAVSGIIFVSGIHAIHDSDPSRYSRLVEMGLPIVLVNGYLAGVPAPFLSTDDARSVELAVNHLRQLGHDRIGIALGQARYTPVIRKAAAFTSLMRRSEAVLADEEIETLISRTTYTVEGGVAAAQRLLDVGVTAIVCGSDVMALGVIRAVRAAGLRVPEDVSVVGSDDSLMTEFTDPPLTTVRQPAAGLATAACRTLLDQISGHAVTPGDVIFQPELVLRGSTAKAPAPLA